MCDECERLRARVRMLEAQRFDVQWERVALEQARATRIWTVERGSIYPQQIPEEKQATSFGYWYNRGRLAALEGTDRPIHPRDFGRTVYFRSLPRRKPPVDEEEEDATDAR